MKVNKITGALIAMGIISLAGAVQANTVIYLTGSTAARTTIGNALQAANQVFPAGGTIVSPAPNNSASGSLVVFEGTINGVTYDIDCSWTGSEAGIAAVANAPLQQKINGTEYNLPGVPPSFLVAPSWNTTNTLAGTPDLTMADTSQAVSQTSENTYPLTDYGIVGIVPFTFMKSYNSGPDQAWNDLSNVTTAEFNQNLSVGDNYNANNYTGVAADSSDGVAVVGRNFGSGTRANCLVNMEYGVFSGVSQYGFDVDYPSSAPGVLTFGDGGANYGSGQPLVSVGNDGFDSGSGVGKEMTVDSKNDGGIILVGYLGMSDAKAADTSEGYSTSQVGTGTYLSYNGVYESDTNVLNGEYTYWGAEHLYGTIGQSATGPAGIFATNIVAGIAANLKATAAGTETGDVRSNNSQSAILPLALMQVHRAGDGGFPIQGAYTSRFP